MEKIVSLAKRRGFIFPSSEIYGGFGSGYDYGPLGVELKNNIKKEWWREMIQIHDNIVGLDSSILMNPKVWEASGHLTAGFADFLVECKKCHKRFKGDEIKDKCPECGGSLTSPKKFNLMMKTFAGPVEEESSLVYLRAETTQGIYVNFKNVLNSMRLKIPFGIAQIGKAFRNEINPKNFIYRTREFEQMEMEWFCHPKEAPRYFEFWKEERMKWYQNLGIKKENLRIKEIPKEDLPHYAKQGADLEYKFPFGWGELEAIHNRGDWDLSNHSKHSGQDLGYLDPDTGKKYYPYIVETSAGVDRSVLAFLSEAYSEVKGGRTQTTKSTKEIEILLSLHKRLAPIKVAVLPLVRNKKELTQKAKEIYQDLKRHLRCQYDEVGSIGRRYRRQDEIGTLFAVTVDFETLEKNDVTVRDRDTMKQVRVPIVELLDFIKQKLED
ncbi:glycine--tRNA ligase [bacterium]|nr:glycine--tRNA ligase [bacterium]